MRFTQGECRHYFISNSVNQLGNMLQASATVKSGDTEASFGHRELEILPPTLCGTTPLYKGILMIYTYLSEVYILDKVNYKMFNDIKVRNI